MRDESQRQNFSVAVNILVGSGTTTIQASPGANARLVVTRMSVAITTSAAQSFDIESSGGTVELYKAPASLAVGLVFMGDMFQGVPLPVNEALQYTPSAAGVGATIWAEGWIDHTALNT